MSAVFHLEVLARLVPAAVFKTVEPHGNHVVGGFDSHAFPPLNRQVVRVQRFTQWGVFSFV